MVEKSFLIDPRIKDVFKFWEQVDIVVSEILDGNDLRILCPDDEYAQKFTKAVDEQLKKFEYIINGKMS